MIRHILKFTLIFFATSALAHDHAHPDLDDWYMHLANRNHVVCCDLEEAKKLNEPDWQTQNKPNSHYRVFVEGEWIDVPDDVVVDGENKAGHALVWTYYFNGHPIARCFMPGTMT